MLLIERLGLLQRRSVEEQRILPLEDARTNVASDVIVQHVAAGGGNDQQRQQDDDIHATDGGHGARHEQQRVAWQEGRDDKTGLAENDGEEDGVDPHAVLLNKDDEIRVQVQHDVDEGGQIFHVGVNSENAGF